ncbi:MAG: FAD-dependent oxidoreductase [Bacteriovoracaceae bacterium]|nr:FAD-dependent oxidoreductase [Bacteriovoracaceae bacterium]
MSFKYGLTDYLSLNYIKENSGLILGYYEHNPLLFISAFFTLYVLITALSLPGASIMTLAGGAFLGLSKGVIVVSFASTIGATLAFLVARFLFQDFFKTKYREKFNSTNNGVEKEGDLYLFGLRLVPIFPFFLINILMGLTNYKTWRFFVVSQVGMLPGTFAYVNAGTQLASLESASGILSPSFLLSFALLGLIPLVFKSFLNILKKRKVYKGWKKPDTFEYDIIAIGAGAGGLVSSYIGAAVNAKVALIEKHKMGGDCLNTGCVPSKAIIKSAKIANIIKNSEKYGITVEGSRVNFENVMSRIKKVIKKVEPHDSVQRYTDLGVHCISGEAEVLSPWEVRVNGKVLSTRNIILATGARPLLPPIPGLSEAKFLTSDTIWDLKELPRKLAVLGGGPIGVELAQSFKRLGAEVSVIEAAPRILVREDEDVSKIVIEKLIEDGIKIYTNHKAVKFLKRDGQEVLVAQSAEKEIEIEFDYCLVALGRKANTNIPGLDKLALGISKTSTFEHDEYMRTKYPNIFVVGDCAGPFQFTHTAAHQAWYAAVNALFAPLVSYKADYRVVPWCTFTEPEIARVGISETEAKDQGIAYELVHYDLADLDRAIAEDEDYGLIKVIVAKGTDQILGAAIVSTRASELLGEFTLAMKYKIGLNKILGTIHAYPTFPEAIKYAAGEWKRSHKPEKILRYLKKFHAWRRG